MILVFSSLGKVLLVFISGFELDRVLTGVDRRLIAFVTVGATLFPLTLMTLTTLVASLYDWRPYTGELQNILAIQIIVSASIVAISIPVISKIFLNYRIMNTRFAKVVLAAATIQDMGARLCLRSQQVSRTRGRSPNPS